MVFVSLPPPLLLLPCCSFYQDDAERSHYKMVTGTPALLGNFEGVSNGAPAVAAAGVDEEDNNCCIVSFFLLLEYLRMFF